MLPISMFIFPQFSRDAQDTKAPVTSAISVQRGIEE